MNFVRTNVGPCGASAKGARKGEKDAKEDKFKSDKVFEISFAPFVFPLRPLRWPRRDKDFKHLRATSMAARCVLGSIITIGNTA